MAAPSPHQYAAIDARVSTEEQGQGFAIPTPIEACHKHTTEKGTVAPESNLITMNGA